MYFFQGLLHFILVFLYITALGYRYLNLQLLMRISLLYIIIGFLLPCRVLQCTQSVPGDTGRGHLGIGHNSFHYIEKKVAESQVNGEAQSLAAQTRIYPPVPRSIASTPGSTSSTPFSRTSIQQAVRPPLHQSSNGNYNGASEQAPELEVQTMQTGSSLQRGVVSALLGALVQMHGQIFQAAAAEFDAGTTAQGRMERPALVLASSKGNRGEGKVAEPIATQERKETQEGETWEGAGGSECGTAFHIRTLSTIPFQQFEHALCHAEHATSLGDKGIGAVCSGHNGTRGSRVDCRGEESLSRCVHHAGRHQRPLDQKGSLHQQGCGHGNGQSHDVFRHASGTAEGTPFQQEETPNGLAQPLGHGVGRMARACEEIHRTTGGVRQTDLQHNHTDGADSLELWGVEHQSSSKSAKSRDHGRPGLGHRRRTSREDGQKQGCLPLAHMFSRSGRRNFSYSSGQRLRGEGDRRKTSSEENQRCRTRIERGRRENGRRWKQVRNWLMTFGCSLTCLRNDHCEPLSFPKTVHFASDVSEPFRTGDGPIQHDPYLNNTQPHLLRPALLEDDCCFDFTALQRAQSLSMELLVDDINDEILDFEKETLRTGLATFLCTSSSWYNLESKLDFLDSTLQQANRNPSLCTQVLWDLTNLPDQPHHTTEDFDAYSTTRMRSSHVKLPQRGDLGSSVDLLSALAVSIHCEPHQSRKTPRACRFHHEIEEDWGYEESTSSSLHPYRTTVPDHLQPTWCKEIKAAVQHDHTDNPIDQGQPFQIRSWYLNPNRFDTWTSWRPISLGPNMDQWPHDIRAVWHDIFEHEIAVEFHVVFPHPPRPTAEAHYILDLILAQELQPEHSTALILTAWHNDPVGPFRTVAKIIPHQISKWELIYGMQLDRHCGGPGWSIPFYRKCKTQTCTGMNIGAPLIDVPFGSCLGITMGFPEEIMPIEDDVTLFMAAPPNLIAPERPLIDREDIAINPADDINPDDLLDADHDSDSNAPSEEPNPDAWQTIQVYSLSHPPAAGRVDWSNYDSLHRSIADVMEISRHDLQQFFQVRATPLELEVVNNQIFVALEQWDILPGHQRRLVLVDVEFHSQIPAKLPETVREARLFPHRITRQQILSRLGLLPYCQANSMYGCMLWKNNVLQFEQFSGYIFIDNGDYIRIAIPPEPTLLDEIATRTATALCYKGLSRGDINVAWTQGNIDPINDTLMPLLRDHDDVQLLQLSSKSTPIDVTKDVPITCRLEDNHTEGIRQVAEQNERLALQQTQVIMDTLPRGLADFWLRIADPMTTPLDEEPTFGVLTWFLHSQTARRCNFARVVQLPGNPLLWTTTLIQAWHDEYDHTSLIEFHLVYPQPYDLEYGIQAHLLLIQVDNHADAGILITSYDNAVNDNRAHRFATMASRQLTHNEILHHTDRDQICSLPGVLCQTWVGWDDVTNWPFFYAAHGMGVTASVLRPLDPTVPSQDVWQGFDLDGDEAHSLLQLQATNVRQPTPLILADLLVNSQMHSKILWLINCTSDPQLPPFIEVDLDADDVSITTEIRSWGHSCYAAHLEALGSVLCLDVAPLTGKTHYVFVDEEAKDHTDLISHPADAELSDFDVMRLLHQYGYHKAVVTKSIPVQAGVFVVHFVNLNPQYAPTEHKQKAPNSWPSRQPLPRSHGQITGVSKWKDTAPDSRISVPLTAAEMLTFMDSTKQVLQTDLGPLQLPEDISTQVNLLEELHHIDRLLIFTDGSSPQLHRHAPTQWIAEQGTPDSWAFAVFAEQYLPDGTSKVQLLGWTAQQVLYEDHLTHYIGTQTVGSSPAETEALLWAALWRLAQNHCIPTIFLSDSVTTIHQATGKYSSTHYTEPFQLLRAAFQALEALLPQDDELRVTHVTSHTGFAPNELVDTAARTEGQRSMFLPRQQIDMKLWRTCLPFLWMFYGHNPDIPEPTQGGFDVRPIQLPASSTPAKRTKKSGPVSIMNIALSVGTANVCSLYRGPDGHAGKLDYLRAQFAQGHFNILAIQEARSDAGTSTSHNILRLSSGHDKGTLGVELWISLSQPIGYVNNKPITLARKHVTVVHATPRMLIARVEHPHLQLYLSVGHAPHCGHHEDIRSVWWQDYTSRSRPPEGVPLIAMLDANALSGKYDGQHVLEFDDASNFNTDLFRDFLDELQLMLPATSKAHIGQQATWTSPSGLHHNRIDYVCIPIQLTGACSMSRVVDELDLGQLYDHMGVAVQLQWTQRTKQADRSGIQAHRGRYARDNISADLDQTLRNWQGPSWDTDIEGHVNQLNEHLVTTMELHCPRQPTKPKKFFITEEIWQLRRSKLQARKALKTYKGHQRTFLLRQLFDTWRGVLTDDAPTGPTDRICKNFKLLATYLKYSHQLSSSLRRAKLHHLHQAIEALPPEAPASQVLQTYKGVIGPTNPNKWKSSALPIIRDEQGQICRSAQEAEDRWIQFFGDMEGGVRLDQARQRDTWIQGLQTLQTDQQDIASEDLPTLVDLERAYRRVASNKATGLDDIPSELCHHCPRALARLTYPILLKMATQGQEALQHKGGKLVPVHKRKGPHDLCSSYRSILISSHVGKSIHRALRQKQMTCYTQYLQDQQIGGRPGVPVTLGVHFVRAYTRIQGLRKRSWALIFLDLTEAFYRVFRPLALGGPFSDETIAQIAAKLNLPQSAVHDFHAELCKPPSIRCAALPPHLCRTLEALHTDTWTQFGDQQDITRTEVGTRPGDSFADVVFGYMFAKILKQIEHELHQAQCLDAFAPPETPGLFGAPLEASIDQAPFLGPTWMDDLAICLSAESAQGAERKAKTACSILLETCARHFVTPNLKKGKTEIIFSFRGPGSQQLKRHYYGSQHGQQLTILHEYGPATVAVVGQYQHLGGTIHHSGSTRQELRRRFAIAHGAFSMHRRALLQNQQLAPRRRRELFVSLIESKLSYGTESWYSPELHTVSKGEAALRRLYRRLCRVPHDAHMTQQEIYALAELPTFEIILRRARLRYLATLYKADIEYAWRILPLDAEWMYQVREDLRWMWRLLQRTSNLGDPDLHPRQWEYIIRYHPGYWRTLVRRAVTLATMHLKDHTTILQSHRTVWEHLRACGWITDHWLSCATHQLNPEPDRAFYGCLTCKQQFKTKGGEGAHLFKHHGVVNGLRYLFDGTSCPHCLKEFHTHGKVFNHLTNVEKCRSALLARGLSLHPAPGRGSQVVQAQCDAHNGLLPVLPAEGPLRQPDRPVQMVLYHPELLAALAQALLDFEEPSIQTFVQMTHEIVDRYTLSWTTFQATIKQLDHDLTEADAEVLTLPLHFLRHALHHLCNPDTWDFTYLDAQACRAPDSLQHVERQFKDLSRYDLEALELQIPRVHYRERVILHAFSGRRRPGDVQWFIEQMTQQEPEVAFTVISVDIVIDANLGDVTKHSTKSFWIRATSDGLVRGFLGGPPCETWSIARGKEITQTSLHRRAPRILRDASSLWGFTSLSIREKMQTMVGNDLLLFAVTIMILLAPSGGCGILEHPKCPIEPNAASIWKLPIIALALSLPGMTSIDFSQGLLGATSAKPTTFMVLNMPSMLHQLHCHRLTHSIPVGGSIGVDNTGSFKTGGLKEYPPALCRAIACEFHAVLFPTAGTAELPDSFSDACKGMLVRDFGAHMGRDHAG